MQQRVRQRRNSNKDNIAVRSSHDTVVQAKLTLGAPDDAYEREADRLAAVVMRRLAEPERDLGATDVVARAPAVGAGVRGVGDLTADEEQGIHASRGGGAPLDAGVRVRMEQGFGADFSHVRVHTGARADELSRSLTAQAFTTGSDVFFSAGTYRPGTSRGDELLAHELAHTIQQGASQSGSVARRRTVPDVQAFGFGKNKQKQKPPKIDESTFMGTVALLKDAENGVATLDDLQREVTYLKLRRQMAVAKKRRGRATEIATIDHLENRLALHLERRRDEAASQREAAELAAILKDVEETKRKAKEIYLREGQNRTFAALSTDNEFFDTPVQQPGVGVAKNLDEAEVAALSTYTADDYKYINPAVAFNKGWLQGQTFESSGALKEGQRGGLRERLEEGGLHTGMVMSAFAKLPVWSGDGFRGERLTPEQFEAQYDIVTYTDGWEHDLVTAMTKTTTRTAFWSVSLLRDVAEGFADGKIAPDPKKTIGILYHVKVSNARDVALFSKFPEAEVVCPPSSKYTVTDVMPVKARQGSGDPPAEKYYEVTIEQT